MIMCWIGLFLLPNSLFASAIQCRRLAAWRQGLGKTISLIALLLTNKPAYFDAARHGTPHGEPQSASSSSGSSSASDLGPSPNPSRNPSRGPSDPAGTSSTADSVGTSPGPSARVSSGGGGGGGAASGDSAGAAQGPQMAHPGEERPWLPGVDRRGGTLVVCPTSVLRQWEREIASKVATAAGAPPKPEWIQKYAYLKCGSRRYVSSVFVKLACLEALTIRLALGRTR